MLEQVWGTLVHRWYVVAFAVVFLWRASRHLGWRRTLLYGIVAVAAGAAAENGSVHVGVPYTKYAFNPAFRGHELYLGDVPVFVPLSYAFSNYFAFATARLVTSGPWRTRAARPWEEWGVAVVLAVWPVWILDPASRLGDLYLGHVFTYADDGFWFGLPLLSQVGYAAVSALVLGLLAWLAKADPDRAISGLRHHPHLVALVTWHVQWMHLAVLAIATGHRTLGGSAFLMYLPAATMTAILWGHLRQAAAAAPPIVATEPAPLAVGEPRPSVPATASPVAEASQTSTTVPPTTATGPTPIATAMGRSPRAEHPRRPRPA